MIPRWGLRRATGGPLELVDPDTGELLSADDLDEIREGVPWFEGLIGGREIATKEEP